MFQFGDNDALHERFERRSLGNQERIVFKAAQRAGIEPFAYVGTLEARVQLLSLLRHKLEFSSLRLGEASINLVKTDAGPWNFQFLLNGAPASAGAP